MPGLQEKLQGAAERASCPFCPPPFTLPWRLWEKAGALGKNVGVDPTGSRREGCPGQPV